MGHLGIECKYECPACGNILTIRSPYWTKTLRKELSEPERCGCGRRRGFNLTDFKKCNFEVVPEDFEVAKRPDAGVDDNDEPENEPIF